MQRALHHVADMTPTADQIAFDATRGLCDPPAGARLIPLTRGLFTVVDEADFEIFGHMKWTAHFCRGGLIYAFRNPTVSGKSVTILLHRAILNPESGLCVDHRNKNGLDNRRANLRACTPTENNRNARHRAGRPFRGVSIDKGRFRARIAVDGREILVGYFDTAIEAALARDEAAKRLHGEFASLNFPEVEGAAVVHALTMPSAPAQCCGLGKQFCGTPT